MFSKALGDKLLTICVEEANRVHNVALLLTLLILFILSVLYVSRGLQKEHTECYYLGGGMALAILFSVIMSIFPKYDLDEVKAGCQIEVKDFSDMSLAYDAEEGYDLDVRCFESFPSIPDIGIAYSTIPFNLDHYIILDTNSTSSDEAVSLMKESTQKSKDRKTDVRFANCNVKILDSTLYIERVEKYIKHLKVLISVDGKPLYSEKELGGIHYDL